MNWRAELRSLGVERRPSHNDNSADRGFIEQPGEGVPDKPPPSVPRVPPHSQRPQSEAPLVLRRPVTSLTPAPEPPRDCDIFPPPLPPPSAAPTEAPAPKSEPPQQTLVKLVKKPPEPKPNGGRRPRRHRAFPEEFKQRALARYAELGGAKGAMNRVGKELDFAPSVLSRWLREQGKEAKMPPKKGRFSMVGLSLEQKDEWARRAIAMGRGGAALMAKRAKVSHTTMLAWIKHLREREGTSSAATIVSAPASKVQSKPNGAHPPQLGGFLTGLDDYIAQLVDARVEAKLVEILKTKSLMELMRR